jgi:hypothetical protein
MSGFSGVESWVEKEYDKELFSASALHHHSLSASSDHSTSIDS